MRVVLVEDQRDKRKCRAGRPISKSGPRDGTFDQRSTPFLATGEISRNPSPATATPGVSSAFT
jgi:hypothetical protein